MIFVNPYLQAADPTGDIQADAVSAIAITKVAFDNSAQVDAASAIAVTQIANVSAVQVDATSVIAILNRTYP